MTIKTFLLKPRVLFSLAFIIVLASNSVVLIGATLNRSGTPTAMLAMSERELSLPSAYNDENSVLAMQIKWRVLQPSTKNSKSLGYVQTAWLNAEKLQELGFDLSAKPPWLEREVFLALELNGANYQQALKQAQANFDQDIEIINNNDSLKAGERQRRVEQQKKSLQRQQHEYSRLYVIDAATNADDLLSAYNDPQQYIITKGIVRAYEVNNKDSTFISGQIINLSVQSINVPIKHSKVIKALQTKPSRGWQEIKFSRYQVNVAYGTRFEPWIEKVQATVQ